MDHKKKHLPSSSQRKHYFMKNGAALQEKLIATFGARYKLPIHCFTAKELLEATNNFLNNIFDYDGDVPVFQLIRGSLRGSGRSIIAVKHHDMFLIPYEIDEYICNIVMTSQLSHLKHVIKLVGCCLEFECPVLVYESVCFRFLGDLLYPSADDFCKPNKVGLLTWRNRLKMAKEIAYAISYLHNAFPTPIIYRNLGLYSIIIDEFGVPKLFDFSAAVQLPPGKKKVEMQYLRTDGFLDPNCFKSLNLSQECDVYGIGILLLVLITGKKIILTAEHEATLLDCVKDSLTYNHLDQIVDGKITQLEDGELLQLEALVELALKCTQQKEEDRPDMINVTKELCRIEKIYCRVPYLVTF